ncbi:MAG: type II toxin-antitoxin system VapC family toxin [Actinomycetota bacterium]
MPVVDASVVVDWVAPGADPSAPPGRLLRSLGRTGQPVYAPRLLLEEVANALLTGVRRGRWSGVDADAGWQLLRQMPVQCVDLEEDLARAWELSRRYDEHPIYDMRYVALAERLGVPLVTADHQLRERLVGLDFLTGP